jgi:glutamine synthetase
MQVERREIRSLDHISNKYFAFAAMIYCGLDGIENKLTLTDPVVEDPANLDSETRLKRGIKNIPNTFAERKALILGKEGHEDIGAPIRELLGDRAIKNYLCVHERDHELFS